jgi:uncharacterized protein YlxW (UPF0749 family)
MPAGPDDRPARQATWRGVTLVVVLMTGFLFAVSAAESGGTDLRPGRFTDFASVVRAERQSTNRLTEQVEGLNTEIDQLSADLGDRSVGRMQERIETLADPAGLTPVSGPGLQITLDDAPQEVREVYPGDIKDLVVHQQDIQAAANALWRGGAEAVTIQGQRLVSTTGIKCEGNNVTLHGVPYSPPYVIVGIGDVDAMEVSVAVDPYLAGYREDAADPVGGVSWAVEELATATAPAYDGLIDVTWATPIQG